MYKLFKSSNVIGVQKVNNDYSLVTFLFDPANTDYADFKADILADKATLQDADGNEMTAEQAKEFVLTLP